MKKGEVIEHVLGGKGSGNWGHAGRPGEVGGSVGRSVAMSLKTGPDCEERKKRGKSGFGSSQIKSATPLDPYDKGVNDSVILEFADGSKGIFKSEDMEHGSAEGEILAYELSEALGWGIVPETIEFTAGGKRGSLQKWVDDAEVAIDYKGPKLIYNGKSRMITTTNPNILRDYDRMQTLDNFLDNNDRHGGNWLVGKDRLWAIDNGGSFGITFGGKKSYQGSYYDPLKKISHSDAFKELQSWAGTPAFAEFGDRVTELLGYEYAERILSI